MKVIFLEFVPNVGHLGEIKEVTDSYARNFLIPKKYAKAIDKNEEQKILEKQRKKEENRRSVIENKNNIFDILNSKTILFKENVKKNGKIFGGIKATEIINKINKDFGIKLEKKNIVFMNGYIKKIGKTDVYIKLSPEIMAKITVIVE